MTAQAIDEGVDLELTATKEQQEVIKCRAKFLCVLAGRRYGKTVGIVRNRIISRCLEQDGFRYLLVAPSMAQVLPEYEEIESHPELQPFIRKAVSRPYPQIAWVNGSVVKFRSLEKSHFLRRDGYDEIWVDEIQDVREAVLDRVLLPMLADRRGCLGMSGQSRGEEHFIQKRFFMPGQNPRNWKRMRSWRYETEQGPMFQSEEGKAELASLRAVTPSHVWDSEYRALPTANSKAVFRYEDLFAAKRGEVPKEPVKGHQYVLALDLGRIKDPSSFVVLDCADLLIVASEVRPIREKHEITSQVVLREKRRWCNAAMVLDSTGSGRGSASKVDEYIRHYQTVIPDALPFLWNHSSKKRFIDQLCLAIEQHRLAIPEQFIELHRQLGLYEFKDKGDFVTFGAPVDEHDDLVAALAMAWAAYVQGWSGRPKAIGTLAAAFA